MEISAGDLLTMCKLKNTDATCNLHVNQRNKPGAAQIIVIKSEEIKRHSMLKRRY